MNTKERIIEFIKFKGLRISEFEKLCSLSNGYVFSMRKDFGKDKLNNVLNKFPELNRNWLVYGEGEMLLGGSPNQMKERLLQFLTYKGISQRAFCRRIGMSENWVTTMCSTCRIDTLDKIGESYPDLNMKWLTSGKGDMLDTPPQPTNEVERLLGLLEEKDRQINNLIEIIKSFGNK